MSALDVALVVVHRLGDARREFLLARRVPEAYWSLIAGLIEEGERADEGASRELAEETGLENSLAFEPIPITLGYEDEVTRTWMTLHTFAVEAPSGWEPVLDEEHDAYRWCSAAEADALLAYPEPREAVAYVARLLGEESS